MKRRTAPPRPLPASEYFQHDTAGPDPAAAWVKYFHFCKNRGGAPVSSPGEFRAAWEAQRRKYEVRREQLGITVPSKKARRRP